METIKLSDKEITINELDIKDSIKCSLDVLTSVGAIIDKYQEWHKSTFELAIEKPKLFYKLLSQSTGESKKYIKSLKASDYDLLVFIFLAVNAEFFIQRLKLIQMSNG